MRGADTGEAWQAAAMHFEDALLQAWPTRDRRSAGDVDDVAQRQHPEDRFGGFDRQLDAAV
jgi:hypothetical protein